MLMLIIELRMRQRHTDLQVIRIFSIHSIILHSIHLFSAHQHGNVPRVGCSNNISCHTKITDLPRFHSFILMFVYLDEEKEMNWCCCGCWLCVILRKCHLSLCAISFLPIVQSIECSHCNRIYFVVILPLFIFLCTPLSFCISIDLRCYKSKQEDREKEKRIYR